MSIRPAANPEFVPEYGGPLYDESQVSLYADLVVDSLRLAPPFDASMMRAYDLTGLIGFSKNHFVYLY